MHNALCNIGKYKLEQWRIPNALAQLRKQGQVIWSREKFGRGEFQENLRVNHQCVRLQKLNLEHPGLER